MKSFRIILAGLAVATVASGFATTVGTTAVPQTCFSTLTGNLANLRLTNNNLVIQWGSRGDCLYFTPTGFNAPVGSSFKVGKLCNFNVKDRYDVNGQFSANLNVGVSLSQPGAGLLVCTMPIRMNQVAGGNDHIYLPTTFDPKRIVLNGRNYIFSLQGFKTQGAGPNSPSIGDWVTPGDTTTCLDLYGKLELDPVPEPATMAALGIGVLALARRRRKQ